jgi:hypothetical protein
MMRLSLAAAVTETDGNTQTLTSNAKNRAAVLPSELCTVVQAATPELAATENPTSPDRVKISTVLDDSRDLAAPSSAVTGTDLLDLYGPLCRLTIRPPDS